MSYIVAIGFEFTRLLSNWFNSNPSKISCEEIDNNKPNERSKERNNNESKVKRSQWCEVSKKEYYGFINIFSCNEIGVFIDFECTIFSFLNWKKLLSNFAINDEKIIFYNISCSIKNNNIFWSSVFFIIFRSSK